MLEARLGAVLPARFGTRRLTVMSNSARKRPIVSNQLEIPGLDHARAVYAGVRRLLVCGSRHRRPVLAVGNELRMVDPTCEIVVGCASGVDSVAADVAHGLGLRVSVYSADWGAHGRAAGPLRNAVMLDSRPDLVLAFWDGSSPGTGDCIRQARKRGIACRIVTL